MKNQSLWVVVVTAVIIFWCVGSTKDFAYYQDAITKIETEHTQLTETGFAELQKLVDETVEPETEEQKIFLTAAKARMASYKKTIEIYGYEPAMGWNTYQTIETYFKAHLKDPESLKDVSTQQTLGTYQKTPCRILLVTYRAKNSFGGYTIGRNLFYMVGNDIIAVE
jgi:hypothetical protein